MLLQKKSMNGKRKKNNTRSTSSKSEEPNFAQHHDGIPPTRPSTNDDFQQRQYPQQPQGNVDGKDSSRKQDETEDISRIRGFFEVYDLRYDDFWCAWFSGDQDKWLSDLLPACNGSLNLSHLALFSL